MLGFYEGFPAAAHKTIRFATFALNRSLQQRLAETLRTLNTQMLSLEKVTGPSIPQCSVSFEFGIAEAHGFNYLDDEETSRVLKTISKKPLQMMDFFCALRYHKLLEEKKISLKFDYYMLRFAFGKGLMEAHAFHERGPMYTSPEDMISFVVDKVNEGSSRKVFKKIR
jgi:hypothetical protein